MSESVVAANAIGGGEAIQGFDPLLKPIVKRKEPKKLRAIVRKP